MNVLKVMLTLVLAALLLIGCLGVELMATARQTALQPAFYDARQQEAYLSVARALLRDWSALVLRTAPAEALRTTDRQEAYALAAAALPPERIAAVLAGSLPEIARWAQRDGELPVLLGARGFPVMADDLMAALLKPGLWQSLAEKPALPLEIPFTDDWNAKNGEWLNRELIVPRYYGALYDNALIALAVVTGGLMGLLYLLWRRRRGVFCAALGAVLLLNGLLIACPAVVLSFLSGWVITELAAQPFAAPAVAFLGPDFASLCQAVLAPFRGIWAVLALALVSLSVTSFTTGIDRRLLRSASCLREKESAHS